MKLRRKNEKKGDEIVEREWS